MPAAVLAMVLARHGPTMTPQECRSAAMLASTDPNVASQLQRLFNLHMSDKARIHGYHRYYDTELPPSSRPTRLLEIGVNDGASMLAWENYYNHSRSRFYGVAYHNKKYEDLVREKVARDVRTTVFQGDQSDPAFLEYLAKQIPSKVDVLIDDGSHIPSHQWRTFLALWPLVAPGGVYAIEDIETSYWSKNAHIYGYSMANETSLFPALFELVHSDVNHWVSGEKRRLDSAAGIVFGQNIVLIRKTYARDPYYGRKYAIPSKLPKTPEDALPGRGPQSSGDIDEVISATYVQPSGDGQF